MNIAGCKLDDSLGPWRLRQLAHEDRFRAGHNNFLDLQADLAQVDVQVFQDVGGNARALLDQPQQKVRVTQTGRLRWGISQVFRWETTQSGVIVGGADVSKWRSGVFTVDEERHYSEAELLEMLKCSRATIARHRRAGKLAATRVGNNVFYQGHKVLGWLHRLADEWQRRAPQRKRPSRKQYEPSDDGGEEDEPE